MKVRDSIAATVLCDSLAPFHHLHSLGYVHRDIKLDNYMVDKKGYSLLDLGIAAPCHSTGRDAILSGGTLEYMPPLQLLDASAKISPALDW